MKTKLIMCVVFIAILISTVSVVVDGADAEQSIPSVMVERGIIDIWTDSDFTVANGVSNGSGTEQDPYIIENWLINGTGTVEYTGIIVDTTNAYCIIRNCEILGFREEELSSGINIYSSSNVIIENCYIYDNNIGISMWDAVNVEVNDCLFVENGYIDTGGGGGLDMTGIQVLVSSYVTIYNNELYDEQTVAIRMYRSNNCTVEYNYISDAIESGIISDGMTYSTFRGNYITGCLNGFYGRGQLVDDKMEYCLIVNNTFTNSIEKGIFMLDTENNTFYYNNLINNGVNVIEFNNDLYNGGVYTNIWYNINTKEGNYYDDYIGTDTVEPYGIGDSDYDIHDEDTIYTNVDLYPLVEAYTGETETVSYTTADIIFNILLGFTSVVVLALVIKTVSTELTPKKDKGGKK